MGLLKIPSFLQPRIYYKLLRFGHTYHTVYPAPEYAGKTSNSSYVSGIDRMQDASQKGQWEVTSFWLLHSDTSRLVTLLSEGVMTG